MVVGNQTGEGLADDQADVQGQAGILAGRPAGTFQDGDVIRVLQDDVAGALVRDDVLQVGQTDVLLDADQLRGSFQRDDLAVVGVGEVLPGGTVFAWGQEQLSQKVRYGAQIARQRVLARC